MSEQVKFKRAFGNCERCSRTHCAVWFVGSLLLCKLCRDETVKVCRVGVSLTSHIASDLDKRARELALEVVRRYLPDESPDVGRGRRCCEYIESRITAALQAEREKAELEALKNQKFREERLIAWLDAAHRQPANIAFTAGHERQVAYRLETVAISEREKERTRIRTVVERFIGYMPAELEAAITAEPTDGDNS